MLEALAPFAAVFTLLGLAGFVAAHFARPRERTVLATAEARLYEVQFSIADHRARTLCSAIPTGTFTEDELIGIFMIYRGDAGQEIARALEEIFSPKFAPEMTLERRISGAQSLVIWMRALYTGDFAKRPLPIDGTNPWTAEAIESVRSFVEVVRTTRHWPEFQARSTQ